MRGSLVSIVATLLLEWIEEKSEVPASLSLQGLLFYSHSILSTGIWAKLGGGSCVTGFSSSPDIALMT